MKRKSLFRIETHLRDEYRWAYTARQAADLVYREYKTHGLNKTLEWCLRSWRAFRRVEPAAQ